MRMKRTTLETVTLALLYVLFALVAVAMGSLLFALAFWTQLFADAIPQVAGGRYLLGGFLAVCGALGLYILYKLIRMMHTTGKDPFTMENVKSFGRIGVTAEIAAGLFIVKCFVAFTPMTAVCGLVMLICGLFALVLAGLFKRAVAFKEENDLTI